MVLKLDLFKAYNWVDWGFLIFILLQIGLNLASTNWIMACVESVNYFSLINVSPTWYFRGSREVRKGFPLSPLLFLLFIEGFSILIEGINRRGEIKGLKISNITNITHILFIDDVMIFGEGCLGEWRHFKVIVDTFCRKHGCSSLNLNPWS